MGEFSAHFELGWSDRSLESVRNQLLIKIMKVDSFILATSLWGQTDENQQISSHLKEMSSSDPFWHFGKFLKIFIFKKMVKSVPASKNSATFN